MHFRRSSTRGLTVLYQKFCFLLFGIFDVYMVCALVIIILSQFLFDSFCKTTALVEKALNDWLPLQEVFNNPFVGKEERSLKENRQVRLSHQLINIW